MGSRAVSNQCKLGLKGVILSAVCGGTVLMACSQEVGGVDGGVDSDKQSTSDTDIPSIYIDRKIQHLEADGSNGQLEAYRQAISICQKAGLPARPLAEDEVALIGTERWQFWRMPGKMAYRVDTWGYDSGDSSRLEHCHFSLTHGGGHKYYDSEKTVWSDLDSGEKQELPAEPDELNATAYEADDESPMDGWSGPLEQAVQGQPCMEWRSPDGAVACRWSGGAQWGFEHANRGLFATNTGFNTHNIVLKAEPGAGRRGIRLTTEQFVIDGTFDPAEMLPDANSTGR